MCSLFRGAFDVRNTSPGLVIFLGKAAVHATAFYSISFFPKTSKMFSYTQENSHTALSSATLPPEYLNHCVWEAPLLCPMQKLFCNLVEFVFYTKTSRYDKNACENTKNKIQWTSKRWIRDSLSLNEKKNTKVPSLEKWARRLVENVFNINKNAWKRNTNLRKSCAIANFTKSQLNIDSTTLQSMLIERR